MPDSDQSQAKREADAARRRAQFARTKEQGLSRKIKVRLIALGAVVLTFLIGMATNSSSMAVPFFIVLIAAGIAWRAVR